MRDHEEYVEHKIKGKRSEVEEGGDEPPVLLEQLVVVSHKQGKMEVVKLRFPIPTCLFAPYCLKAEEELKSIDEVALTQDRSRCGHHRDIKEPLF